MANYNEDLSERLFVFEDVGVINNFTSHQFYYSQRYKIISRSHSTKFFKLILMTKIWNSDI